LCREFQQILASQQSQGTRADSRKIMDGVAAGTGETAVSASRARLADPCVCAMVVALLVWGWHSRADTALDPHEWPGYLLGLGGSLMMLAVLGFSWRKRLPAGRGSVGAWYNAHVLLGLFGAVAVVVHARFAWGSINSSFALGATLLVVLSGLVARYALGPARRSGRRWGAVVVEAWHYLHVPLYMVLVVAVIVHVYMAHAY
jgi:hypothetical protein